jgi:hypothetical protein
MKNALILGCSHSAGSEMYRGVSDDFDYGRNHSYPVVLAELMGYVPNNQSIPGGSNDAMFRIFEERQTKMDSTDIVIACWTGYNRTEVWDDKNNLWCGMAPGKEDIKSKEYLDYQQQWVIYNTDGRVGRLNKIKNILSLNTLATEKNIKVINIDSFWPVDNFTWPKFINWPIDTNFWDWCIQNNYPKTDWGHFFQPAHRAFSEFIIEKGGHYA